MIGETFGNFKINTLLGQGGMGSVYAAAHRLTNVGVAIKVLAPEVSSDKDTIQRFFNEAIAVERINHAGVVKVFDFGFHAQGQAYLVMELLKGESLRSRIGRSGRLGVGHVADIGRQIASVLEATHAVGIVHRDLKPDNIFLVPDAELKSRERVKILDFGIAKLTGVVTPTTIGAIGTPQYMAPEQWRGSVDWRADAYSLGCVVYEMCCGRPPFGGSTIGEICAMHIMDSPPSIQATVEVPAELDELVQRLLAKEPDRRARSMGEIGSEFESIGRGHTLPQDPTQNGLGSDSGTGAIRTPDGVAQAFPHRPSARSVKREHGKRLAMVVLVAAILTVAGAIAMLGKSERPSQSVAPVPQPQRAAASVPDLTVDAPSAGTDASIVGPVDASIGRDAPEHATPRHHTRVDAGAAPHIVDAGKGDGPTLPLGPNKTKCKSDDALCQFGDRDQ